MRHLETGARVAAGFFKFCKDVLDRDGAESLVGKGLGLERSDHVRLAHHLCHRAGQLLEHTLHHRVGFGVNAGGVQRVVAIADAQEASRLLKGLGA